jgi:hypothetical protein
MSCSRCGFFNLPGTASCVSCGTPLGNAGGAIATAIAPPRATTLQKRFRQARQALLGRAVVERNRRPGAGVALMGLVPGLPQALRGSPWTGAGFFVTWAAFLASAVCFLGVPVCPYLIGGAIGTHFTSAVQPWRAELNRLSLWDRTVLTLATYAFLAMLLYFPLYQQARKFVTPVELNGIRDNDLLRRGDTVLAWTLPPGTFPPVGSLVAFRLREGHALVVDRLIGLPGDRIQYANGAWTRNGVFLGPAEQPLARTEMPKVIDITLPAGLCFAWPSLILQIEGHVLPAQELGLMPADHIVGVPTRIVSPFRRRGPLKTR